MSKFTSFFGRIREAARRAASGRPLSRTAIINGTRDEVNQRRSADGKAAPVRSLLTPFATSYLATWTLQRIVAGARRTRQAARGRLESAHVAYVRATVAGRMLLLRPDLPSLRAEYDRIITISHGEASSVRRHRLSTLIYVAVLIVCAVVDWPFFFNLIMDVQDASPKSPTYLTVVIQSGAFAAISPLVVIVLSEWGGKRLARLRFEIRELLDAKRNGQPRHESYVSLLVVPGIIILGLVGVVIGFLLFAQHRFEALASGVGSVGVDPNLLALLLAAIPVAAMVASVAHHDLASSHRARIITGWEGVQAQIKANQEAVHAALGEWNAAWGVLRDLVGRMIAEGQISVQTFEHLVLRGLAIANQRGETSYTYEEIAAQTDPNPATPAPAQPTWMGSRSGEVVLPVPQVATSFASAGWITDELAIDLEWLIIHAPGTNATVEAEVKSLLDLAYDAEKSGTPDGAALDGADADGADPANASEPAETADASSVPWPRATEPRKFDTGEFETMFAHEANKDTHSSSASR